MLTVSTRDLAQLLGVTSKTIAAWGRRGRRRADRTWPLRSAGLDQGLCLAHAGARPSEGRRAPWRPLYSRRGPAWMLKCRICGSRDQKTPGWIPVVAQVPGVALAIGVENTASVIGMRCLTKSLLISLTWDLK